MTEKSSSTVSSYSVHEDQLKWFDVPLVAGGKAAVLHGDPTKAKAAALLAEAREAAKAPPASHEFVTQIVSQLRTAVAGGKHCRDK